LTFTSLQFLQHPSFCPAWGVEAFDGLALFRDGVEGCCCCACSDYCDCSDLCDWGKGGESALLPLLLLFVGELDDSLFT